MEMGSAGSACLYTASKTNVPPKPAKITKKEDMKQGKLYCADFATSTE